MKNQQLVILQSNCKIPSNNCTIHLSVWGEKTAHVHVPRVFTSSTRAVCFTFDLCHIASASESFFSVWNVKKEKKPQHCFHEIMWPGGCGCRHKIPIRIRKLKTYLIRSNKLCSFSLTIFDGLAAISHNNFGKHASRILLANVILSFKSICSNLALLFDFFARKSSMSLVDGESKRKNKIIIIETER